MGNHVQRVHTEPVVLDIGDDIGALIIYTTPEFCGREIEISLKGGDAKRTHTDVAERHFNGQVQFAGVFPLVPAGEYLVWGPDPEHPGEIAITGGAISELDWRQAT
jgi:hypothetical protein